MSDERDRMYKQLINNIIPADDLHWCEEEGKYVSLSKQEMDDIITTCIEQGMTDLQDVFKFVQWCGNVRVAQILWKNFLSGSLRITGFDEDDEPRFTMRTE